jgi:chitin synthase
MSTQERTSSANPAGGAAPSPSHTTHLTALITQTGSSTMYPTEDDILSVLSSRTRADLPYTYLDGAHPLETASASGGRTLIVVNPLKSLGNLSDLNAKDYVDKFVDPSYASSSGSNGNGKKKGKGKAGKGEGEGSRTAHLVGTEQPHLYDLAGKVWLLMQRRREDQAIVFR